MEIEKPLYKMDYIINIGMLYWALVQVIIKVNTNWKVKGILNVIVEIINVILFKRFDSFYFWRNLVFRMLALVWMVNQDMIEDKQLKQYLKEHQEKLKEDLCWKGLIDDFQDGVILVSQNKEISYKNNPVDVLFGINQQNTKKTPHPSLIMKSFECRDENLGSKSDLNESHPMIIQINKNISFASLNDMLRLIISKVENEKGKKLVKGNS